MQGALKRTFDVAAAAGLLAVLWPLLLIIAILIKLDSQGPVLFRQKRIGKDEVIFQMYKFRTMVVNAEQMGTGLFSYDDDPRVTRVGRRLRKASLDELPQLLNVIAGTMSIVGPRPPVVHELDGYGLEDAMKLRFSVKPGITGRAQVSGRNTLEWHQKIVLDDVYVERYRKLGVLEDFAVLFKTLWVVLSRKGVIEPRRSEPQDGISS
jgi:lipopolysaccharide/colanic/teichoic acid biosynthesis glycosyltransferase